MESTTFTTPSNALLFASFPPCFKVSSKNHSNAGASVSSINFFSSVFSGFVQNCLSIQLFNVVCTLFKIVSNLFSGVSPSCENCGSDKIPNKRFFVFVPFKSSDVVNVSL